MSQHHLRLVVEAGTDPVEGTFLDYEEETIVVNADSPRDAREKAIHQMTLRPMGRILRVFDIKTAEEITHASPAGLRPGRFEIDGLPGTYDGFTRNEAWNGFAVPLFPLAEARRIADDYADQPAGPDGQPRSEYDAVRDVVRLYDPSTEDWDEWGAVQIETDREPRALYPVGARCWTWQEIVAA